MNIDIENDVPLPDDGWVSEPPSCPVCDRTVFTGRCHACGYDENKDTLQPFNPPTAGPNDCTFIGGPLNGKFGPIKGNAKVVEIELYNTDGSVSSVELYSLGDKPTPTFRYHVGSKQP